MDLLPVLLGLNAAVLLTGLIGGATAWTVICFAASVVPWLLESIETAIAEKIRLAAGDTQADDVSP
jgi:hypothetical protein